MSNIYVRFITEEWNPISAAIRFETKSWVSHVELVKVNEKDEVVDVLACRWPHGLQHYPYLTKNVTREEWHTMTNVSLVWKWMDQHVGQLYDLSAIFGIALDSDFHNDNRDICSESLMRGDEWAISQPGRESDYAWLSNTNVWRVAPAMLLMVPEPYRKFYRRIR